MEQAARCLDSEDYRKALHSFLHQGLSFPVARQQAARQLIGPAADCLGQPNNNLGVEYLRALRWCGSSITPFTLLRQGAGHGEAPQGGFASASYLRRLLREQHWEQAQAYLLPGAAELLSSAPLSGSFHAERAILYRLRQLLPEDLAALPDCGEGLSNRLYRAIRQGTSVEEILFLSKSKRYPLSRLRRILLWAFLGMTAADRPETPPYLRILGMNETGRTLLRNIEIQSSLPILAKPAHVRRMPESARHTFELEARATDLYGLCLPTVSPCGAEWTASPIYLS